MAAGRAPPVISVEAFEVPARRGGLARLGRAPAAIADMHLSAFGGYSNGSYPIFNTEEPQTIAQAPEHGTQQEAGLRYEIPSILTISSALYRVTRDNVFTLTTIPNPNGAGNIDLAQFFGYRVRGWETDIAVK